MENVYDIQIKHIKENVEEIKVDVKNIAESQHAFSKNLCFMTGNIDHLQACTADLIKELKEQRLNTDATVNNQGLRIFDLEHRTTKVEDDMGERNTIIKKIEDRIVKVENRVKYAHWWVSGAAAGGAFIMWLLKTGYVKISAAISKIFLG